MRQLEVVRFWLPLYASWLLMTAEGPLVSAAVNRLPDEVVMLAAFGVVLSVAVFIESPVFNLLATATALVEDRHSLGRVRRFTVCWMALLSAVSAAVAFTPLFDLVVRQGMSVPEPIARWVRPGLMIMTPWTAVIAWRRFLQGVLIQHGQTRALAWGTALRLLLTAGTAGGLAWWGGWPGIHLATTALVVGVIGEAVYATVVARPAIAALPATADSGNPPLGYRALCAYHLPLAGTSVLTLLAHPLINFCLARLDRPTLSLAAWPLVFQMMLMMRAAALALPEVVIALGKRPGADRALRRFAVSLAAASLGAMLLLALSPLAELYLLRLQGTTAEIAAMARTGILIAVPLPAMAVLISWLRGRLMKDRRTTVVNGGMVVRLAIFVPLLAIGLGARWPGIATAAWAVNLSLLAELGYLLWRARRPARAGSP